MPPRLALTVLQPYASAIVAGVKPVENRTWPAPDHAIGQTIWIHAGKSRWMLDRDLAEVREIWPGAPASPGDYPLGLVLGTATLVACVPASQRRGCPWSCGPWCWVLSGAKALREPFPARGQLGLWELDPGKCAPQSALLKSSPIRGR